MTATIGPSAAIAIHNGDVAVVTTDGASLSWQELYDEYAPALLSYARSRGIRAPDDLVQDVLVTAVERLPSFEGDRRGLRSLLFAITYRRVADAHRRFYGRREVLVAEHPSTADHGDTIEELVTTKESAGEAMRALGILSHRERQVLEMRIIEEATPAEVAEALGLSNGNVRVIQARALVKVRKYLNSGRAQPMASAGLLLTFLKSLRAELPTGGELEGWIEGLRADTSRASMDAAVSAVGHTDAITGAAASTGLFGAAMVKIGLIVSIATASTVGAVIVVRADVAPVALSEAVHSTEPRIAEAGWPSADPSGFESEPTTAESLEPRQVITGPKADQGTGQSAPAGSEPSSPDEAPVLVELSPAPEAPVSQDVADPVDPVAEPVVESVVETVGSLVEETLQTVVDDVVIALVDDVVQPLIDDVVAPLVADTTDLVVNDVIVPLVEETVEPLVENLAEGVESIVDVTKTIVPGLAQLFRS